MICKHIKCLLEISDCQTKIRIITKDMQCMSIDKLQSKCLIVYEELHPKNYMINLRNSVCNIKIQTLKMNTNKLILSGSSLIL